MNKIIIGKYKYENVGKYAHSVFATIRCYCTLYFLALLYIICYNITNICLYII